MSSEHSDVLSQVLKLIRLRGDYVFHGELGTSAEVIFPPGPATFLHLQTGELSVAQRDGEPVLLQPGDFVLLPHADGHTIRGNPGAKPQQRFEANVYSTLRTEAQTFRWATDDGIGDVFSPDRSITMALPCDRC
jgi:glyoxylate utilization-related uncharacterized protein